VRPDGLVATTQVEVLARLPDRTLLRVSPRTGRRHQIRVHLAHAGHPIVGDLLYGPDERQFIRLQRGQPVTVPSGLSAGRHLLHAERLAFDEPASGQRIEVVAPWPADFGGVLGAGAKPI
jgi:23S rRNA-/tRNA-specific pseudouridylate synthase